MFKDQQSKKQWFCNKVEVRKSPLHGLGIFAFEDIEKHECIERAPVLAFHRDTMLHLASEHAEHVLHDYVFSWVQGQVAVCLGYGSLYNHSNDSNVTFQARTDIPCIEFIAKRDIVLGEELLVHYRRGKCDIEFDLGGGMYE